MSYEYMGGSPKGISIVNDRKTTLTFRKLDLVLLEGKISSVVLHVRKKTFQ